MWNGTTRRSRWAARGSAALCAALLLGTMTLIFCRATVADPDFYTRAVSDADGYQRVYDEVLIDPEVREELRSGAAGVPLRSDLVIDNLPLLAPPSVLERTTEQAARSFVGYASGDGPAPSREALLRPLAGGAEQVARQHLIALRADTDAATAARLTTLARQLQQVPGQWEANSGAPLTDYLRPPLRSFVHETWDPPVAQRLYDRMLDPLLNSLEPATEDAKPPSLDRPATPPPREQPPWLTTARPVFALATAPYTPYAAAALLAAAFALALHTARRAGRTARYTAALICGTAAGAAALVGAEVWWLGPAPDELLPSGLPPSLHALLADVVRELYGSAALVWWRGVAVLAALTLLLVVVRRASPRRWGLRLTAAGAVASAQLVLLPTAMPAAPPAELASGPADRRPCNGSVELCDRPYDRVVQIGTHNAMATVADGFLGAHQDPSITGQLDMGVRALMLDTHRWETGRELLPANAMISTGTRRTLVKAVDDVVSKRKGAWLCHGPCRLGATRLTTQLRELRRWMDAHPRDVVTLVVQDDVSAAETRRAFRAAGLDDYLRKPPAPGAAWPTLGEMADSGRRLVVFPESADGPMPWYRNFYSYAVETPYEATDAESLTCEPARGGDDRSKKIFLLNHFVTREGGADRAEAARVNAAKVIEARARVCARARGRLPTIIAVNHVTLGDAMAAARRLNAEPPRGG
ncbi:hypothetical protein G5C51_32045 [Streptomyces sp. A7024]|uniref:Uncharacterized protein n=1 Tax=Streptomyces coryli TaxID=1128680 RepID=A0A6G4UB15_9ACTN|nr:hypothetical protein [Streptomyces coryli]NGN68517.1 hypothetical protein [Streptomyces coryli]